MPRIIPICRKLGIDFAQAMVRVIICALADQYFEKESFFYFVALFGVFIQVGFDVRKGHSIPIMDGVVVCAEFEQTLRQVTTQPI